MLTVAKSTSYRAHSYRVCSWINTWWPFFLGPLVATMWSCRGFLTNDFPAIYLVYSVLFVNKLSLGVKELTWEVPNTIAQNLTWKTQILLPVHPASLSCHLLEDRFCSLMPQGYWGSMEQHMEALVLCTLLCQGLREVCSLGWLSDLSAGTWLWSGQLRVSFMETQLHNWALQLMWTL